MSPSAARQEEPLQDEARLVRGGYVVLIGGFGGFLLWASLAPLAEGVPAPAVIAVDTQRKTVQHQSGGTVTKVLVKEAQTVAAGDVLLEFDATNARSHYEALEEEWRGAQAQHVGKEAQLKIVLEQLSGTRDLAKDGYLPRNKLFEEERQAAELRAAVNTIEAASAKLKRNMTAAASELEKTKIRAPVSGKVVGLAMQTVGGVVPPGAKMMDIVPEDELLVLEAQVPPHLIDRVHGGMPVDIRFSGFSDAPSLSVAGKLTSLSADRLTDPATRVPYFLARVEVTPEGLKQLGGRQIQPGMSANVILRTGRRTMLNYLLTPLLRRISTSFSER